MDSHFHGNDTNREKGGWSELLRLDILIKKDSLNIASMEDISSMKVIAIIQRGTKKDFSEVILIVRRNAISGS